MTVFMIILAIAITLILNIIFAKKITNKSSRIIMDGINIILSLAFIILFVVVGAINKNLNKLIDLGINQLEVKVNEIYPGCLDKQMSTDEIKELLDGSLEVNEVSGIEDIAANVIKSKIHKISASTLKTINSLEREKDKLSVKDALISLKEISVTSVKPYFRIARILLVVLYFILCLISILLAVFLSKNNGGNNKGVVFGEEADKTSIGLNTEDI